MLVALVVMALGQTAGALMSQARAEAARYARARVVANAAAHGLVGAREYDDTVTGRAVFASEAGLSFLHLHAEGLGPLILLAGTLVATLVPRRRVRGVLYTLFVLGACFPLGWLVYMTAVLEIGHDAGVALAERYVLAPLGTATLLGLLGLAAFLRRPRTT